jgi:hypothetical protein
MSEASLSKNELDSLPLGLQNEIAMLKKVKGKAEALAAEAEERAQKILETFQTLVGRTVQMEGLARHFFKPGESFDSIPHSFEDWTDRPEQVRTGYRAMTVLGTTENGIVVRPEGEDLRYPILDPSSLNFGSAEDSGAIETEAIEPST